MVQLVRDAERMVYIPDFISRSQHAAHCILDTNHLASNAISNLFQIFKTYFVINKLMKHCLKNVTKVIANEHKIEDVK